MGFLLGKTAVITGGGRTVLSDGGCGSIGYGIAVAYAKEGANLVITVGTGGKRTVHKIRHLRPPGLFFA